MAPLSKAPGRASHAMTIANPHKQKIPTFRVGIFVCIILLCLLGSCFLGCRYVLYLQFLGILVQFYHKHVARFCTGAQYLFGQRVFNIFFSRGWCLAPVNINRAASPTTKYRSKYFFNVYRTTTTQNPSWLD